MKALIAIKSAWSTLLFVLISMVAFAQEKVDVDLNVGTESHWYAHPVAWVVGAAIFILLLVALLRGKK